MRIIIIQSIAFFDKNGDAGGGEIHLHRLASEWKKKGNEVILFTNTSDLGSKYYGNYDRIFHLRILDAKLKNGATTLKMYLQWFLQFRQLRSIVKGLNKNTETLVIAGAPTISDIILFGLITRRLETTGVVYFHHIPPSPLWNPFKRGGITATTIRWLNSQISLLFTKVFRAVPVMDHPLTLIESGWIFSYGILNDDDFLDVNPADYEEELFDNYKLSDVILKMDCEGCEFEVIPNLKSEISAKISSVIMEYHADPEPIIKRLQTLGFRISTKRSGNGGILFAKRN